MCGSASAASFYRPARQDQELAAEAAPARIHVAGIRPAVEPGDGTRLPADAAGFFRDNRLMATPEITPHEAHLRQSQGAVLVDVRADHERELGMAEGARGIARRSEEHTSGLQALRRHPVAGSC